MHFCWPQGSCRVLVILRLGITRMQILQAYVEAWSMTMAVGKVNDWCQDTLWRFIVSADILDVKEYCSHLSDHVSCTWSPAPKVIFRQKQATQLRLISGLILSSELLSTHLSKKWTCFVMENMQGNCTCDKLAECRSVTCFYLQGGQPKIGAARKTVVSDFKAFERKANLAGWDLSSAALGESKWRVVWGSSSHIE